MSCSLVNEKEDAMTAALDYDLLIKLCLIGSSGSGKSSIAHRFVNNQFSDQFLSTIGVEFYIRTITIQSRRIKLQIWDTSGSERFQSVAGSYYRGTHAIVVVYDMTKRESFDDIANVWTKQMQNYAPDGCAFVLLANKADLVTKRQVSVTEGQQCAQTLSQQLNTDTKSSGTLDLVRNADVRYLETSAKDSLNVLSAFSTVAELVLNNYLVYESKTKTMVCRIRDHEDPPAKTKTKLISPCCTTQ